LFMLYYESSVCKHRQEVEGASAHNLEIVHDLSRNNIPNK
jgi:hypothetical protein